MGGLNTLGERLSVGGAILLLCEKKVWDPGSSTA